jgi:pimeloyl-ACP methyl ester carboxylesterase
VRAWAAFVLLLVSAPALATTLPELVREDRFVDGEPGIRIFVRRVSLASRNGPPILLLHGARVPGIGSFDLRVPGGSLAADLARAGLDVYLMDVRGYGQSTRPAEMAEAPAAHVPLVRSAEAASDIGAVVDWICAERKVASVSLFGWATGGHWAGFYASLHPSRVSHLILFNSLYGGYDKHPAFGAGSDLEDPAQPGRFNVGAFGAYRFNTAESLFGAWDRSIPTEEKTAWRDPAVAEAYAAAALESDPTSRDRTPPTFRSPSGAMEDSYYLASGRQLWDASLVRAPTLIVRSERDFWSRPEDVTVLAERLVHAVSVRTLTLPQATHLAHLDRPEHGRDLLLQEIVGFLTRGAGP